METTFVPTEALTVRAADGSHILQGRCVPYNAPTTKAGAVREVFRPGAFAGAVDKAAKIRLTDHNHTQQRRPVGVALQLDERADGLYGAFRFYDTPEGRAAFENVREQTYGGLSIGFVAVRDRVVSGTREVLEARLHHVSLVDEPAYDGAVVLDVRSAASRWDWMRTKPANLDVTDVGLLTPLVTARR